MSLKEYTPGTAFTGVIGRTFEESEPAWPRPLRAKPDAPNVLFIVLDDTGFGQLGCYGSPIRTPNLDRLARGGLLYTNMHTTALCSPSRSCMLTGRNHHSNAMSCITEGATGYPGSNGRIPFENGFLSEILLPRGYSTFAIGKWHLTPAEEVSAAGPYDRWPLGRGFERFYGFLGGDTHQYYPDLVYDNHQVAPPKTPEQGYHLTEDLVDHAKLFIADAKQVAPEKPFFLYFCPGAMHAPHHAPKEFIDRYKGAFDDGWDAYRDKVHKRQLELGVLPPNTALSAHDPDVAPWDSLGADERRLYARMMEVFAGYLEHTDHQIGRLLDYLEESGQLDNTLIMVISDNGASAEGGPHGSVNENLFFNNVPETLKDNLPAIADLGGPKYFNHYPWGWAWAGNTPFRRWKRETYRGGSADPFIVHYPNGISAKGEIRTQYAHIIDMLPTVLDVLEVEAPTHIRGVSQSPIQGVSFAHTFDDPTSESHRQTQYFEMMGHRSIYHDGWRAVCPVPGPSFTEAGKGFGELVVTEEKLRELDATGWELYHVAKDFSETRNVAAQNRPKLIEMIALWYVEAGKHDVLPIDSRGTARLAEERPQLSKDRKRYVFYPGTSAIGNKIAPRILNRPHSITASVDIQDGAEGVLLAQGGASGGYSLYVKGHKLHYAYNYFGVQRFHVATAADVPPGKHELRFEFEPTGAPDLAHGKGAPGRAQLYIDGTLAAEMDMPVSIPLDIGITEGLTCGRDDGSTVTDDYVAPFAFTGGLSQVAIDVSGELIVDTEAAMKAVMAHQ
ncbi:MAG: sulfatase-like hydrolase/transferase [Polyangiaceae bacterium]|nr:sulfatase-like hydrolase/transferase [Polyangiaceae bacterium]